MEIKTTHETQEDNVRKAVISIREEVRDDYTELTVDLIGDNELIEMYLNKNAIEIIQDFIYKLRG